MLEKPKPHRLLADENTSHRVVAACRRLAGEFPIIHIARWQDGSWLGLDDAALLLMSCAEAGLVLVAFDRATLPWHAGQVVRAGESHGGLILFRRSVRSTNYGEQAPLLTEFWFNEGLARDWTNRIVYTPISWIEQQAADAAKEYRQFTASDVTDDMHELVLRVIVNPDTPTQVTADGMRGTQSVSHVVLRDESKKIVIQPTFKEPFTREVSNAMGGKAVYQGVLAKFPLDAVRELRGKNGDREFFVTVIGDSKERDFKVKKKHFERLP